MIPGTTEPLLASHTPVSAAREGTGLRRAFWSSLGLLVLCFGKPLYELVRFAVQFDLYSHILLVPFICAYLVWINRHALPPPSKDGSRAAGVLALAAFLILSAYWALSL